MEIFKWNVEPKAVKKGVQHGEPYVTASNPCPCGCSPKPFVLISNGKIGLTVCFETAEELESFKSKVRVLQMDDDRCRFCEHLVTVSPPNEDWVGGCEYKAEPLTCGRFELAKIYEGHDPRPRRHATIRG
jgi:hypothetical protein